MHTPGAAMAQWIALAARGRWAVGLNPIRVIGGARRAYNHNQLLLCSRVTPVPRIAQKKPQFRVFHRVWRLLKDVSIFLSLSTLSRQILKNAWNGIKIEGTYDSRFSGSVLQRGRMDIKQMYFLQIAYQGCTGQHI